jgi:putative glutamine amidotransferase
MSVLSPGEPSPFIGLTAGERPNPERPDIPFVYSQLACRLAIENAGGVTAIIPTMREPGSSVSMQRLDDFVMRLDGVFLTGGHDIHPQLYGEAQRPTTEEVCERLDATELRLVELARLHKIPLLGICRGAQILNVAHEGGTLYQDLPTDKPSDIDHHNHGKHDPLDRLHTIDIKRASVLGSIMLEGKDDPSIEGDGHHHQAVKQVGEGLRVVATARDGVIEAIETTDSKWFAIGVQWHDETTPGNGRLFEAFITAAQTHAAHRALTTPHPVAC